MLIRKPLMNAAGEGGGAAPAPSTNHEKLAAELTVKLKDVNAELEASRKQLAETNTTRGTVEQELARLKQIETEFAKLQSEHAALKNSAKPDGGVDLDNLVKQTAEAVRRDAEETIRSLKGEVDELKRASAEAAARELRSSLIAQNGGDSAMYPSLVKGNTEQEILASIAESKRLYGLAFEAGKSSAGTAPKPGTPTPAPATPTPSAQPAGGAGEGLDQIDVRNMTLEQYKAKRAEILEKTKGRYASGALVG